MDRQIQPKATSRNQPKQARGAIQNGCLIQLRKPEKWSKQSEVLYIAFRDFKQQYDSYDNDNKKEKKEDKSKDEKAGKGKNKPQIEPVVKPDNDESENSAGSILKAGMITTAVLVGDDITGIGVADDVLIPPIIVGTLIAAGGTWLAHEIYQFAKKKDDAGYNESAEHTKGKRKSTKGKHEEGMTRKNRDKGGEKGDARRKRYK